MKHTHALIPVSDAQSDVSDWWHETFRTDGEEHVEALFDVESSSFFDFHAGGHGAFHTSEYSADIHYFIGLTVEDSDDIRFIPREEAIALAGPEQVGKWQDGMDEQAN